MNRLSLICCFLSFVCSTTAASETDAPLSTRNLENPVTERPENLLEKLAGEPVFDVAATKSTAHSHHGQYAVYVYDAWVELLGDADGDGFYHAFRVVFDLDTDYGFKDVYAVLSLRASRGPFVPYYATEVFTLVGTAAWDDYEVTTSLVEGFPADYYDVLIEVFDAGYGDLLTAYGPYESGSLSALPLEDELGEDGWIGGPPVTYSHGGGGSTTYWTLWVLLAGTLMRTASALRRRAAKNRISNKPATRSSSSSRN